MTRRDAVVRSLYGFFASSPLLQGQQPTLQDMVNIFDFDAACQAKVPKAAYEYVSGGGWDEWTLKRNRTAFERITFRPRFFREVDKLDVSTTLFGMKLPMPIAVAPTGTHGVIHPEGEIATVLGAGRIGSLMAISTNSSVPLEKIAAAAKAPLFFQLYTGPDLESTRERVIRAVDLGCRAILVTADAPVNAPRERDIRNRLERGTMSERQPSRRRQREDEAPEKTPYGLPIRFQAKLNWTFVDKLASWVKVPVLIKGILTPEDTVLALKHGATGVVVSNHGGRYLDGDPSTIEVLPEIVAAAGRAPVLIDGGFRRGTDVLKALALGAKLVFVGRPPLWGLGAFGTDGVHRVLELLRNELAVAMALSGRVNVAALDRSLVRVDGK